VFGLQEGGGGPEAEVKTVLRTEVHAQIFVSPSLQRPRGVINRLHPSHIEPAWFVRARSTTHGMTVTYPHQRREAANNFNKIVLAA